MSRRGKGNEQQLKQHGREKAKATSSKERGDLPHGASLFIGTVNHAYYGTSNGPICIS
jgi:hypothetical protein